MPDRNVPDGATRVGHAERIVTIDELSTALAEGRLEMDEADDRIAAATRARTYDDLRVLTTDLPPPAPTKGHVGLDLRRSKDLARRAVTTIRSSRVAHVALLIVFVGLVTMAISGLFEGDHEEEAARHLERAGEEGPEGVLVWPAVAAAVALVLLVRFIIRRRRARRSVAT